MLGLLGGRLRTVRINTAVFAAFCAACGAAVAYAGDEQTTARVDKVFADLEKPGSPGCALGVFRDGKVIYAKGYGLASIELNSPITSQTVFDIGSTSKQFTAASIVLLEQVGKLSFNDDVRKYIPELPDYSKNGGQKITILNLLNHTSGLRDYLALLQLSGVSGDSVTTDDDALALIIRQKNLNFTPGSEWAYSNTGYFLLSIIVRRVSGMTLREFAAKNIFQPLGMTHTIFRNDHTLLVPNRALAYDPVENGYKLDVSYYEQLGDGAVHTSVEDLAKWDENFYSGRVGSKSFLEELQQRGKLNNGKQLDYAKGLFIKDAHGLHTVRHGGAWGGYRAELLRFPDQHFSVACLCNVGNADPEKRADRVADVYLGSLMKADRRSDQGSQTPTATLTSEQLSAVSGMYRNAATRNIVRVSVADGKPQFEIYGSTFRLRALSPTEFAPVNFPIDAKLTFELANGSSRLMKISGDEMIEGTYQKVTEFAPSPHELPAYAGDFKASELGAVYRLRAAKEKLQLFGIAEASGIPRTGMPTPLTLSPTITDEFEISNLGITIHFSRDAGGNIGGFSLDAGRSSGIQFVRTTELANKPTTF